MKGPFAVAAVVTIVVCAGCNQPVSPTSPSSSESGNPSLVLGTPAGNPLGEGSVAAAESVPFRGSFVGSQTVTPLQPPLASVNGSAAGAGTHLGQFTVEFPHTVNFVTRAGVGTFTFTAANGDTLTASLLGQAQGAPPAVVSIVEHGTVTGGTGRFEGATGSFTVQRTFDPTSGATEGTFAGRISAAGAGRP